MHVDTVHTALQGAGTGGEIAGNRKSHGALDRRVDRRAVITEVFEGEVPADAEANQSDVGVCACGAFDNAVQVFRSAAVVGAKEAVQLSTAATQVPGQRVPSGVMEGRRHALHGGIGGIPLQSVCDDDKGRRAMIAVPIEIQKIAVRGLDAFPLACDQGNPPEEYG